VTNTRPEGLTPVMRITDDCVGCGACLAVCPTDAINEGEPYVIDERCVGCGRCAEVCPVEAVIAADLAGAVAPSPEPS
jgi:ferredoxin